MPLLTVLGGPIAPAGETLANAYLTVRYFSPYADGVNVYPTEHQAERDGVSGGWKPLGAANGVPFTIPGAADGDPMPPPCVLVERQEYAGGGDANFRYGPLRVYQTSAGEWIYGTPKAGIEFVVDADLPAAGALLTSQLGVAGGVASLGGSATVMQRLAYEGVAGGVAVLDGGGRLVQDPPGVFNVRRFGAVGDGATNDAPAVQAACDAAAADGGGVVFMPIGTYQLGASIRLASNVTLAGQGRASLLRMAPGVAQNPVETANVGTGARQQNVAVRDLAVDGRRATHSGQTRGVFIYRTDGFLIQNVTATGGRRTNGSPNPGGEGIEANDSTDGLIIGCATFENDYDGIKLRDGCARVQVIGNRSWGNGAGCYQAFDSVDVLFAGNVGRIEETPSPTASYTRGVTLHLVTGGVVTGNRLVGPGKTGPATCHGVLILDGATDCLVEGNHVSDAPRGLTILDNGEPCYRNVLRGNQLRECARAVSLVEARAQDTDVSENHAINCDEFIRIGSGCDGNRVFRNYLRGVTTPLVANLGLNTFGGNVGGLLTENAGVASFGAGQGSVTINHGCYRLPGVVLALGRAADSVYVTDLTDTTFRLVRANTASAMFVGWRAQVVTF